MPIPQMYVCLVDGSGTILIGEAVTIADGADVTLGALADASVAAGAVGSVSAKLRRATQGLEDLKTLIVLAAGANKIGSVGIAAPSTGQAPTNATSTAQEASRIAKASAGTLYGVSGFNNKSSGQYIQLFDSATLPADTAVPILPIWVPATSPFQIDFGIYGRAFAAGIVACNSSTLATKTIGSADCWFDFQYI